jgi:hypothetical protein
MNLRELVKAVSEPSLPYYEFNREERHLAAILFHILNQTGYVNRFLKALDCDWQIKDKEFGIYFEYSYPRDLWHAMDRSADLHAVNERKRNAILKLLTTKETASAALAFDVVGQNGLTKDFNSFFIEEHRASREYIQSPANWSLKRLAESIRDNDALASACIVKWAFRAKPDIVIHTDNNHALCLELKLESIEGTYPAAGTERSILKARGLYGPDRKFPFPMHQTELQRFLMEDLLGLDCRFRFITRTESDKEDCVSWTAVMDSLSPLPEMPTYMRAALHHARHDLPVPSEQELEENG